MKRYTTAHVLAEVFSWDYSDIQECRYQYGRTSKPVFTIGDDYYTATKIGQKPPKHSGGLDFNWEKVESKIADSIGWQVWKSPLE